MIRRLPISTLTHTFYPSTTLCQTSVSSTSQRKNGPSTSSVRTGSDSQGSAPSMHSPPRRRLFDAFVWIALASLILVTAAHLITKPPAMPAYTDVRADWTPSEAWLYDRDGRLLDTERVDFQRRRLGWVPLKAIAPAVRDAVVKAEDRRFWSHGGVDWFAIASAVRTRWTGGRPRGASTLPMQLAAFLAPELAQPGHRDWLTKLRPMRAGQASSEEHTSALQSLMRI